jgi:hypothetical protein
MGEMFQLPTSSLHDDMPWVRRARLARGVHLRYRGQLNAGRKSGGIFLMCMSKFFEQDRIHIGPNLRRQHQSSQKYPGLTGLRLLRWRVWFALLPLSSRVISIVKDLFRVYATFLINTHCRQWICGRYLSFPWFPFLRALPNNSQRDCLLFHIVVWGNGCEQNALVWWRRDIRLTPGDMNWSEIWSDW